MSNSNAGQTGSCDTCGTYIKSSGCGCGSHSPCEASEPTGCEPPTSIASGVKIYVVDTEGCAHLLTPPGQNAILYYNATTGFVEWRTGDISSQVCLPAISDGPLNEDTVIARLPIVNDSGCLSVLTVDPNFTGKKFAILTPEGIKFEDAIGGLIPSGSGLIYSNGDEVSIIPTPTSNGQFLIGNVDGTFSWVTLSEQTGEKLTIDSYRGLKITNFISGAYNANQIQGTVDVITLADTTQNKVRFNNSAFNADITSSGAGGLDTDSVVTGWYYVWLISNGANISSMFSLSSVSPTMPPGYTYRQLVGVVRYSGGLRQYFQTDNQVWVNINIQISGDQTTPQASALTTLGLSIQIPPIAKTWIGYCQLSNSNNNDAGSASLSFYSTLSASNPVQTIFSSPAISASRASIAGGSVGPIPVQVPQFTYWRSAGGGTPVYMIALFVTGFTI